MEAQHTISLRSAADIAGKVISRSKFGTVGLVAVWGGMVAASYRHGKTLVEVQVSFQPELTVDVTGSTQDNSKALGYMLLEAEEVRKQLTAVFQILKVAQQD
jgi:hypothetical protein